MNGAESGYGNFQIFKLDLTHGLDKLENMDGFKPSWFDGTY